MFSWTRLFPIFLPICLSLNTILHRNYILFFVLAVATLTGTALGPEVGQCKICRGGTLIFSCSSWWPLILVLCPERQVSSKVLLLVQLCWYIIHKLMSEEKLEEKNKQKQNNLECHPYRLFLQVLTLLSNQLDFAYFSVFWLMLFLFTQHFEV